MANRSARCDDGGLSGGFGRKGSDDDQRTLVGAAVFSIILIVLVGAGYYFLVYQPYQETLGSAKQTKLNEVNAYFKGPLALDPQKQTLTAEIEGAETPEQALAVDVLTPATAAWREYQTQEINAQKDPYGRVMITYSAARQKNLIMKVVDAQTIVNEADASVLANMVIETPDTVAVPIIITRLQAAGGLVNVERKLKRAQAQADRLAQSGRLAEARSIYFYLLDNILALEERLKNYTLFSQDLKSELFEEYCQFIHEDRHLERELVQQELDQLEGRAAFTRGDLDLSEVKQELQGAA